MMRRYRRAVCGGGHGWPAHHGCARRPWERSGRRRSYKETRLRVHYCAATRTKNGRSP